MSIKVVCGCGFATLVPSAWQGRRVRCKCGRTFVVGRAGAIAEPPSTGDEAAAPQAVPACPPAASEPAAVRPEAPILPPEDAAAQDPVPVHVAEAAYRARRAVRLQRRRRVLARLALVVALAMATAAGYVLHLHDWSLAALLQPELAAPSPPEAASSVAAPPAAAAAPPPEDTAARPVASAATRLANLMPLVSEDGLLLTGQFGDADQRLALTDPQREAIQTLAEQLQAGEEPLRSKARPLAQWYADTRRLGDQLLAVLTDAQRQQLQVLLERGPVRRVQLVEYAARIRPELGVPQVPWSLPSDSRPFRPPTAPRLARVTGQVCGRTGDPTGVLATRSRAVDRDGRAGVWVWDLAAVEPLGRLDVEPDDIAPPCLLSPGGAYVALTRVGQGGERVVEVWETADGRRIGSQTLPAAAEDPAVVRCCTDRAVVATTRRTCWVWEFQAGEPRTFSFPEARPDIAPGLVVSPQGKYVTVAHRHVVGDGPTAQYFLEVCVYAIDSGEMLGNQVLQQAYRRSTIGAMALSPDGRELALLWDFDGPAATRKLVHMLAANGKILRIVDGLQPPPADGASSPLPDRALICLPENSGWVVDLREVVDAETGAVLPLDGLAADDDGAGNVTAPQDVWVEALPAGDGRLLVVTARPADAAADTWSLQVRSVPLPRLGPFR